MVKAVKLEGTSMRPLFKAGDVVLISPLILDHLSLGDCAVYKYEGRTLMHRVVKTDETGAWFADDAGRISPHFVPWSAVRGKVVCGALSGGLPGFIYSRVRTLVCKLINNLRKDER